MLAGRPDLCSNIEINLYSTFGFKCVPPNLAGLLLDNHEKFFIAIFAFTSVVFGLVNAKIAIKNFPWLSRYKAAKFLHQRF